ncbi:MAG: bifunctional UDP-N-acetylmuramoyl-tripeptide:D-alanyl-D-alanine ligase/alanine racemase, partial [Ginsengibacter sp.]
MINYTIEEIAKLTGGKLISYNKELHAPVHLSLDSRKVIAPVSTIFFAIKTPDHDGNAFIESLYLKGVRNFVTDNKRFGVDQVPLSNIILVDNSISALQKLAAHYRKQFSNIPIIGITGSNGKTIIKEWLNQLLENDFSIVRSPKSYNSQIGVPL